MKRISLFLLALFCAVALKAYDLKSDDMFYDFIYYNQDPNTGQYADTALAVVFTPYDSPLRTRTSIVIPAEINCWNGTFPVTEISSKAFDGYDYLKSITLPNTIKRIGSNAFQDCESLSSIVLPDSLREIGYNAFRNCKSLTSIVIPDSVKSIKGHAFDGCSNLRSVVFPEELMTIGGSAFDECTKLSDVVWNVKNCQFEDTNPNLFGVFSNEVYSNRKSPCPITSFVLGDKVETIPNTLCKGLRQLTSITIPASVTTIGSQAFKACTSLQCVNIPSSVTTVSNEVFSGCTSLQYVNIPSSVTTIGSGSGNDDRFFEGVMNGKVCKVDANLISDDVRLFANCKFDSMIIGASVTTLNANAFIYTAMDREPYYGSDIYFESATPPTILNKDAGLGDVVYVHVPAGAKTAYREALGDNYVFLEPNESRTITGTCGEHLTYTLEPTTGDLTISGHGDMYDYKSAGYLQSSSPFFRCRNLIKNITFPEGITSIGEYAFYQCPYPQNHITLPQSLQQIKQYALHFSPNGEKKKLWSENGDSYYYYDNSINVTEIQVGSNVSYIGYMAFSEAVTTISCAATTPPALQNNSYYNSPAEYLLLIRCPRGTSAAYRAAWGDKGIKRWKYIYTEEGMADTTGILVNDVKWSLNFYTRTLSITGKGAMPNFKDTRTGATTVYAPWEEYSVLIDSVYIGDSITYIGNYAFAGFARLQSLTIPKGVVAVGYKIAAGTNLQTVYINASLQDANASIASGVISSPIGDWIVGDGHAWCTFDDTKLANVHFADNVTSIAPYMFTMCDSLRSIVIPNSVKTIGRNAFQACHNLTSIQLPNSLEVIDTACFFWTTALQTIVIPTTIKRIASEAFAYSAITNINLPEGLEVIEDAAFSFSALTSIKLPNSLRELGTEVFAGVEIDTLIIPKNVTKIGRYITGSSSNLHPLKLLVWNAKNAVNTACSIDDAYCGNNARIFETDKVIIGDSVESIPNALAEYTYPSLTIPDKVQKIGHAAFEYTKGLSDTICIGTGLTWFGYSAFYHKSYTPRHVFIKDIGAFCNIEMYNASLSSYYAQSQLYINGRNVNDIGKIVIPDSVSTIYSYAFYNYDLSNVDITFGKNVQKAQSYSFAYSRIRSLTTNNNLDMLGEYKYDSSLGKYTIVSCFGNSKEEAAYIGTLTLGSDIQGLSLYGAVINNIVWNVRYCESCGLQYPSSLLSIEFGDSVLNVPAGLCRNTNLSSVHLPDNVTSIGEKAFYGCSSLSDLSLSSSLLSVGKEAFSGCSRLSSLTFRKRCQLDTQAFYNCTGLQHIYCYSELPGTCASDAFDGLDKFACTLHVPAGCKPKYQVATGWRDFYYTEEIGAKEIAVSVTVNNDNYGTVTLSSTGVYHDGDQLTLTATANTGYSFLMWSDDVFANPRTITLTQDTTLVAYFYPLSNEMRYITAICNPEQGQVTGGGDYYLNTEATLTAVPAAGYRFVQWSNGITDNPYIFTVTEDLTIEAQFISTTAIENVTAGSDSVVQKVIRDGQVLILRDGKTYTTTGIEL